MPEAYNASTFFAFLIGSLPRAIASLPDKSRKPER